VDSEQGYYQTMIRKTMKQLIFIVLTAFTLTSCYEKKSIDALETYMYWAGTKPPKDLELLEGKYWESAHWSKEYSMFLKIRPTKVWWDEFLKQNNISEDKNDWTIPSNAPDWFKPSENSVRYSGGNDYNHSRYFRDNQTGICYIYEIQL